MQGGKLSIILRRNPLDGGECMGARSQSCESFLHVFYFMSLVPWLLKGINSLIVSSTMLRGIYLPLRERINLFMCIGVFGIVQGSY